MTYMTVIFIYSSKFHITINICSNQDWWNKKKFLLFILHIAWNAKSCYKFFQINFTLLLIRHWFEKCIQYLSHKLIQLEKYIEITLKSVSVKVQYTSGWKKASWAWYLVVWPVLKMKSWTWSKWIEYLNEQRLCSCKTVLSEYSDNHIHRNNCDFSEWLLCCHSSYLSRLQWKFRIKT